MNSVSGVPAADPREAETPRLEVDVRRRRGRHDDAFGVKPNARRVSNERHSGVGAEVADVVRCVPRRVRDVEAAAAGLDALIASQRRSGDRRAPAGTRPRGDPCRRPIAAWRSRSASTDRRDAEPLSRGRRSAGPAFSCASVPATPAWSRWMCVRRMARTSAMLIPACASSARSVGSELDGPGSMSATPPGPCSTTVAMIRGTLWNWRSKYERPVARVIIRGASVAP